MDKKKNKGYDDELIDEIIAVLEKLDIEGRDFYRIEDAIKNHAYYEKDVNFEDVEDYIGWNMDAWERDDLMGLIGCNCDDNGPHKLLQDVEIKTLDDEYKIELLLKMYKSSCSISELEKMVRVSKLENLNNIIL